MRKPFYAAAIAVGIVVALLGPDPFSVAAVASVLVFPLAAAFAIRSREQRGRPRPTPLGAAIVTALAGGLVAAFAIRLAAETPGLFSSAASDCSGTSGGMQQLVLWGSAAIFLAATLPVAATLFSIGRRLEPGDAPQPPTTPLNLYPVAVVASGLALVATGFVTTC